MKMKFLMRYMILVSILILLTVWILGQRHGNPADAVLVRRCADEWNDLVLEGTGCYRRCM